MLNSFWWGSKQSGNHEINWLNQDNVQASKGSGGLSFRNVLAFNLALLGKQGWKFLSNLDTIVSKIFKADTYLKGIF